MADAPKGAEAGEHTCKGAEANVDNFVRPDSSRHAVGEHLPLSKGKPISGPATTAEGKEAAVPGAEASEEAASKGAEASIDASVKGAEAGEDATVKGAEAGEDSGNRAGAGTEAGEVAAAKGAEQQAPDQQQMQRSFKAMAAKYKCQAEKTRRRAREMTRLVQKGKALQQLCEDLEAEQDSNRNKLSELREKTCWLQSKS